MYFLEGNLNKKVIYNYKSYWTITLLEKKNNDHLCSETQVIIFVVIIIFGCNANSQYYLHLQCYHEKDN